MLLNTLPLKPLAIALSIGIIQACSTGDDLQSSTDDDSDTPVEEEVEPSALDNSLALIIDRFNLDAAIETAHLPNISESLPQLGMKLFFSKSLGGDFDSACVTCHHPVLGGADGLSLSVGVDAVNPDLLGPGRENSNNLPEVPRNAPTVFNAGLWDTGLFWDSRVESLGKEAGTNGSLSDIRTPDSDFNSADANAGANLAAAQARFPVTSDAEMKGTVFESGSDNESIRDHLAARLGDYGEGAGELDTNNWLTEFQTAFGVNSDAEELVTFDNIAHAIGEYERSMVFVESPWRNYLDGDLDAMSDEAKSGALLFFNSQADGGAGCAACHNGPLFSDGQHHNVAFPQAGPGKGDLNDDDFGRERETGDADHRYQFRTPSLLNIAQSAPYGHSGSYQDLEEVIRHYTNPNRAVDGFFDEGGICGVPQYQSVENCESLYPNNESNSLAALQKLQDERDAGTSRFQNSRLNNTEVSQLVAFLEALTDPCVTDRTCISDWVPDPSEHGPDDMQLNAVDRNGSLL